MADVHLGARHDDLGPAAAAQRERQFDAFRRTLELAIAEKVDLVLICGDLFDSNGQPRRSVERAAAELGRLVERHIPVVIIPGTHDCYDTGSIYRAFDMAELAGAPAGSGLLTVMTDTLHELEFVAANVTVRSCVFPAKRAPRSPLLAMKVEPGPAGQVRQWQVGMVHGSIAIPGITDKDEVAFTEQEIADTGLDYLALGHWHSFREGHSGQTVWAYSGAPEPVALDQDGAGQVALVTLEGANGQRKVTVEPRPVGRTRFRKMELDAATLVSQPELARRVGDLADPDLVLDVRLVGLRNDKLDLNIDELSAQLAAKFMRLRIRDASIVPMAATSIAPADTILGAFTRDLRARIAEQESTGTPERSAELREALRLGITLLDEPQRVNLP